MTDEPTRQELHREGYPTAHEIDLAVARKADLNPRQAVAGPHRCRIYEPQSEDAYQNELHEWSEACDAIHMAGLEAIAAHLPEHISAVSTGPNAGTVRCETCPEIGEMPAKPMRPYERF